MSDDRIYLDEGLRGVGRERPGLRQALAACREGDVLVVTSLPRLARSASDARDITAQLLDRGTVLDVIGSVRAPDDVRQLSEAFALVVEFEVGLARLRVREGMAVASAKGRLKGKPPKLTPFQEAHLVDCYRSGAYAVADLEEIFQVTRSTIYRALRRSTSPR